MNYSAFTSRTVEDSYRGELIDAPELHFGQAGYLAPTAWELTVAKTRKAGEMNSKLQYNLSLYVKLSQRAVPTVQGNFGYPAPGVMAEYSYGYGAEGFIGDLPSELVSSIEKTVGFDFTKLQEEACYEYSYYSPKAGDPMTWYSTVEDAKMALEGVRSPEAYIVRREIASFDRA